MTKKKKLTYLFELFSDELTMATIDPKRRKEVQLTAAMMLGAIEVTFNELKPGLFEELVRRRLDGK